MPKKTNPNRWSDGIDKVAKLGSWYAKESPLRDIHDGLVIPVADVLTLLKRAEARGMERAANHCDECSGKLTVHQVAHELWAKADALYAKADADE